MSGRDLDDDPSDRRQIALDGGDVRMSSADRAWVCTRAAEAMGFLSVVGEVRVLLVDDESMAEAHQRHCGVDGTTDVITFDLADGAALKGDPLDVDLLVCLDEAQRQATGRGLDLRREVLLYVLHGMLHCLGFDDHDEAASTAMHAKEDEVLSAIGVGVTFDAPRCGS